MTASHSSKSESLMGPRRSMPFSSSCSLRQVSSSLMSLLAALLAEPLPDEPDPLDALDVLDTFEPVGDLLRLDGMATALRAK